jgi:integrase
LVSFQTASKNSVFDRLTVQGDHHVCRQLANRLGIPVFHPRQLRHTLGMLLQGTIGDAG